MRVTMVKEAQFGPDGPQAGAVGEARAIQKNSDGDVLLAVFFEGFKGVFWVKLEHVLHPDTSLNETFYRSWTKEDLTPREPVV